MDLAVPAQNLERGPASSLDDPLGSTCRCLRKGTVDRASAIVSRHCFGRLLVHSGPSLTAFSIE